MTKKNKTSCIYKITCLKNNKFYIGSSTDINTRLDTHKRLLRKNKHSNPHLQNAWNKYGEQNFKYEIIETIHDINQLLIREKWWIDNTECYKGEIGFNVSRDPVANMRGRKHSLKTRQKLSLSHKGIKLSQEHKNNISSSNTGRKVSESTRQKIGLAQKGKKISKKQRENMSSSHMGKCPPNETMLKLWAGNKKYYSIKENRDKAGKRRLGKKLSKETRIKISKANEGKRRNFQQQTKKDTIISIIPQLKIFYNNGKSLYETSKIINISMPTLTKWLKILDSNLYELFIINGKKKMGINGFKTNGYNSKRK